MKEKKVALIHDWLNGMRGGEKVLEGIIDLFPQADVFTLFLERDKITEKIKKQQIFTSGLNKFFLIRKKYKLFLQFFPKAIEEFDLRKYDLVISSSHCVAKGVIPGPQAIHISYIHSPMRYVWDQHFNYIKDLSRLKRYYIKKKSTQLRIWDTVSNSRVDKFIANSNFVKDRIKRYYKRDAKVIHPPVDTEFFIPQREPKKNNKYFLTVSALVPYKRVDILIEVFNNLKDKLVVVGKGSEEKKLKKKANSNIVFLKNLSSKELLDLYQNAQAFIFSGTEDFGISFVEAQACGIPIIALNEGGVCDIVNKNTGILFDQADMDTIINTIYQFKEQNFNNDEIRQNSLKFSIKSFKNRFFKFVRESVND